LREWAGILVFGPSIFNAPRSLRVNLLLVTDLRWRRPFRLPNARQIANALSDIGKAVRRTSCNVGLSVSSPTFNEAVELLACEIGRASAKQYVRENLAGRSVVCRVRGSFYSGGCSFPKELGLVAVVGHDRDDRDDQDHGGVQP
jgi:hypothetical protein